MKKKVIKNQKYEEYWRLTLEYSDFNGKPFNDVLGIIVRFIDQNVDPKIGITSAQYEELQKMVEKLYKKKDSASTRKAINQFFKLGFINNGGKSYHELTKKFLDTEDAESKKLIYSRIMYENASFSRSYSSPASVNEIKFLVKTLEECEVLDKKDLLALIYTKIDTVKKGYLTKKELDSRYIKLHVDGAPERKYNQCNYLFNLCKHLTDIYVVRKKVSIKPDFGKEEAKRKGRDPYLQRLYKLDLSKEYKSIYHVTEAACVLEKLAYPILIASHIKPYRDCTPSERFDRDNGLLLSKNMDSLFDNGYISFDDDGAVIVSSKLDPGVAAYVKGFSLDDVIYTEKRKQYMEYHRSNVLRK